ncbi:Inorganic phosphate transporter pho84 [Ceratobasidium sp. 428]|nr:Inorganic phosphate transporter pho84 [Ceratobasidium sp. 428]
MQSATISDKHIAWSYLSTDQIPTLIAREQSDPLSRSYNERRRAALRRIDEAEFSSYAIFAIDIAAQMIGYVYGQANDPKVPLPTLSRNQQLGLKAATPIGTLLGQLLFGWLGDVLGRKGMYGIELVIIVTGTIGQALSSGGHAIHIIDVLILWRFIMGVGIGGDYPLSAILTSEFAATRIRGRMMTAVFAMQGFGNFTAALVALIVTEAYKSKIIEGSITYEAVDYCWRLLIGLGAIPGAVALYFRLTIPETPRYTMDVERNVQQAAQDVDTFLTTGTYTVNPDAIIERVKAPKASWADFLHHFGKWENGKILLGTAYSWFALDIAFFGLGLNATFVLTAIKFGSSPSNNISHQLGVYQSLHGVSVGNLILSIGGLIPGYWATFLFIDHWGRKRIQLMGFTILTLIFVCMGFGWDRMVCDTCTPQPTKGAKGAFVFLYCLANFFQNFGPNTTAFIVPGEAFPTRYRSTAHGISAASGKLGAIIAQVGFAQLVKSRDGQDSFIKHILQIFALFMLTGLFATLLIEETKGRSLEDISNEAQDDFISGGAGPLELHDFATDLRAQMPIGITQQPVDPAR